MADDGAGRMKMDKRWIAVLVAVGCVACGGEGGGPIPAIERLDTECPDVSEKNVRDETWSCTYRRPDGVGYGWGPLVRFDSDGSVTEYEHRIGAQLRCGVRVFFDEVTEEPAEYRCYPPRGGDIVEFKTAEEIGPDGIWELIETGACPPCDWSDPDNPPTR